MNLQAMFKEALGREGVQLRGKLPKVIGFQEGSVTFVYVNGRHNKFGWAKRTKGEPHSPELGYQIAITRMVRSMRVVPADQQVWQISAQLVPAVGASVPGPVEKRDVRRGWRRCYYDNKRWHLWNTATTATGLYPKPKRGAAKSEKCEHHAAKSALTEPKTPR